MTLTPPITKLTQQDLLDMAERILPPHYIATLQEIGPGFELLQAFALMFARLSEAVERLGIDSFIDIANTGAAATGEVELFRAGPNSINTPILEQEGAAASIVAGAPAGEARIAGLTNMSAASVGRFLIIQGATELPNNGTFEISTLNSPTSVDVINPNVVIPDLAGQLGVTASIVAGAPTGEMRLTGLTGMSASSVDRLLTISGAASASNNGSFIITTFNSITSVDVANANAVIPDGNNGSLVWEEAITTITWEEVTRTVAVKAGTVVTTSSGGLDFTTVEDVEFLPPDLGPFTVDVRAVAPGYEWNVTGQRFGADGTLLEGEIDTVKVLVEDPPLGDITIQVRQIDDTTGGVDEALAALGRNRGITQGADEDDDSYRNRIRVLPDTVTFDAFLRIVESILRPFNVGFEFIETFEITYQTAYDGPSEIIEGSLYNPNLFTYDDPDVDGTPFRNRWMDENDYRGALIIVIDDAQPIRDTGMVYDDTAADVAGLQSSQTGGARAVGAYDVTIEIEGVGGIQGGYDGTDLPKQGLHRGLFETLQSAKPAGVSVAIELRGN